MPEGEGLATSRELVRPLKSEEGFFTSVNCKILLGGHLFANVEILSHLPEGAASTVG